MQTAIVCRNCGHADLLEASSAQQDLLTVGMLERPCPACKRETRWGRGLDLRRKERRFRDRRSRAEKAKAASERRNGDRRRDRRRYSSL